MADPDREEKLVERVQRLRRERNRVADEHDRQARKRQRMKQRNEAAKKAGKPKPFAVAKVAAATRTVSKLAQRANELDGKLRQAEDELERFRAKQLTPKQRLAKQILESPHAKMTFVASVGGTARPGLEAIAQGKKAPVAAPESSVRSTDVSENLLRALAAMVKRGGVAINCITNGDHVTNSNHYRGRAVDIDLTSPLGAAAIEVIANQHQGRRNFETTHIHIDFP